MYLPRVKPFFDAPMASWTPMLIEQGVDGHPYNIVRYGDIYWAVHWIEGSFDPEAFFSGNAIQPILIGETIEEIRYGLKLLLQEAGLWPKLSARGIALSKHPLFGAVFRTINPFVQRINKYLMIKRFGERRNEASVIFCMEASNLFYIKDEYRKTLIDIIPDSPGLKNSTLPLNNLFEMGDGLPLIIMSPAPARTCNYRCEYCFNHDHGFTKNDLAMDSWSKAVLTAVDRIPRPLYMSMGAMGEPLAIKKWVDTVTKVLKQSHVKKVAFVSNLGIDPVKVISDLDPPRIGVLATLHPSQFKDYEKDLATFFDRIVHLKNIGVSIAVNYVLIPGQLDRFYAYRETIQSLKVPMICNVLRGPYHGKDYPEAYSREEYELAKACHDMTPFVWDYQSHEKNPYGIRCVSGRWGFQLEFDGTVYNCDFARQRLGSIYDDKLMVRSANCFCTANRCESQVMIGMIEDVVKDYKMEGNMHYFFMRADKGIHPLL